MYTYSARKGKRKGYGRKVEEEERGAEKWMKRAEMCRKGGA